MKLKNYLLTIISFILNTITFLKQKVKAYSLPHVPILLLAIFLNTTSYAQNYKPFTIRYNNEIKGNMLLIGNNILGKDNNDLSDNSVNQNTNMQYIDIDSDASTFSSSSANLEMPSTTGCSRIAYAGLYWGAILQVPQSRTDINKIKLKLPGNTAYTDITGELIYDAVVAPIAAGTNEPTNTPYACYADVTSLVSGLTDPQGTYTIANVTSSVGFNSTTGLSAGWTLFIVYEDDTATKKSITSFDGFSSIYDDKTLSIPISGFRTPPSGVINILYAFASLEGDKGEVGSKTEINGKAITNSQRASNRFFNSSITEAGGYFTDRIPNNSNSLGYDTGIESVLGAQNSVINYNATSATITVQVAKGQANPVFSFFNAFGVDVIAPEVKLTKIVKDINGNDIGNTNVTLGDNLYYEIAFQNIGNDNVDKFTLKDVLPNNVIFNYPADITSLPTGVTHTYNSATRTLEFTIPNSLVEIGDVSQTIRLHVQLVSDYNQLSTACSNEIKNQALATYQGVINTKVIQDEGSFSTTTCNFGTPQSTNFLVNIDGHTFTKSSVLCGASATLTAANGYTSYSWSTSPTGTPVVGTNQTYTVTNTGTYYVTSTSECRTITEEITVIPFGNTITNPVIPYADEVVTCQNNGKAMPNIFLCGANATKLIQTNISDASSIEWEKLNESSCAAQTIANCANENTGCQWNIVGTGTNFLVNTSGQFRVTLRYSGGCFSRFYFNAYQNLLNPTYISKDIVCTTNGKITIGGVPSGYEYSLDGTTYQSSNIFTLTTAGSYTVYIRQLGVSTNPCIFSIPNILIRKRNFSGTTIVTQPACNGDKGTIKIAAVDADPQYYYSLSQGATLVNSVGPLTASDYEFANLNPGTYTVRVWTDDVCDYTTNIEITNPPLLTATSALTKPLTCVDGEITVYPAGGTPPYAYYVNGSTSSQSIPQIVVSNPLPSGGIYNIQVVDSKNCSTSTSITVTAIPPPVYTMSQTNIKCYNDNTGVINFNVTNANGYTLAYSIDNGVTYSSNPTFSNLVAGTYNAIVKYSLSGTDCFSTAQTITLSQPTTALTASAGVSELAGCGPAGEGKIRITNPQGGTLPYEYSFDNQATWITANEAYKALGTYTVYIRDANGCTYPMSVTIDAQPVAPTIAVDSSSFNCDGTATSTVTVTNNAGSNYSYEYLIDGNLNPNTIDPKVFLNVPSGSHTISVKYQLLSVTTYSNLLKEDFGSGSEVSSPGINTAFCFEKQNFLTCDKNGTLNNGEYTVTNTIKNGIYSGWHNPVDHTSGSATGRYLAVDAGTAIPNNAVLYRKTIQDIIPNQPIQVRFFATNLLKIGNTQPNASLTVELQNSAGTSLSSQSTGGIPKTNGWVEYNLTINPGNNTSLDFVLRLEVAQVNGIDFAVDDIDVYQLPKSCITQKDFPIIIPTGQAFDASITTSQNITCANTNNGSITIAAQNFDPTKGFQYSIDNGVNWFTQMTSPYTITGLSGGTYNVKIRYDVTSTGSCVKSFTQTLTAPAPLVTTATVTSVATCTAGATITAGSTGGTTAYRYELLNATGTTNIQPSQNTGIFTNVAPGTYIVRGYDANNCTDDTPVVTILTPPTVTATLDSSSDLCFDNMNQASLVANVSGGTSPYVYSLDGAPSQNSNTFSNVGVGTHSIVVTDSFGCTTPAITVTIAPQLTAAITNIKELDCTASPNAIITGTITGGNTPFVVTVLSGTGPGTIAYPTATTFTYTTAVSSNYQFQITDSKGCITTTTATINPLVPVTATLNPVNPSCNGISDGSVQITPSGGVGPYTYSFNGLGSSNTTLYTGLQANIAYPYVVTDSKGCTFNGSVTLSQPVTISGIAVVTAPYTCLQNATIEVQSVSGGTGAYSYSIDGITFQASPIFTGLTNGTYTITIKDVNNCPFVTAPVTIAPLTPPTDLTFNPSALSCPANTSNVTITSTIGGSAPLQYQIIAPAGSATAYQGSNIFNGLAPGTYTFQVKDDKGCTYQENFTINALPAVTVVGQLVSNVKCLGSSTGAVRFTVSGTTNFTYTINGVAQGVGTSPINLTGLAAGDYAIVITNTDTNCTATASITVNPPTAALTVNKTVTPIKCGTNGSVVVTATDGWGGYSYSLTQPDATVVGPQASATFSNLSQIGSYTISVTDANNCSVTDTFGLTMPVQPTASITTSDLCYDTTNQATIVVMASSGVSPYQYSIDGGATYQSSNTFAYLIPGNYSVMVKDAYGCTSVALVQTIAAQLKVATVLTKDLDCTASPDAVITGTITGGYSGFNYTVSVNGGAYSAPVPVAGTTFKYTIPAASFAVATTYQFQVTDANNCPATSGIITVNPKVKPTGSTSVTDLTCNGSANGSVTIVPNLGVAPYTFSFNGSGFTSNATYGGLAAGTYNYSIKDSKDCIYNSTVTVAQPALIAFTPVVTNMSCNFAIIPGSIEVTAVTNGFTPFTYVLRNTTTNATLTHPDPTGADYLFPNLSFGNYELTVIDSKGCSVTQTINLLAPPSDLDIDLSTPIATCADGATIIVSVAGTPAPLVPRYTFGIYDLAVAPFSSGLQPNDTGLTLQHTFTGLTPGVTYTFVVFDTVTGCYYFEKASGSVLPLTPLIATIDAVTPVTCKGTSTGSVSFTLSNYSGTSIDYEVFYDQTNISTGITGHISTSAPTSVTPIIDPALGTFTPGIYYIKFTEKDGVNVDCTSASTTFVITESAVDLTATATSDKNDNCNHTGQISAIGQGGSLPYQYELVGPVNISYSNFSTFPNPSSPLVLTTGNYTVNIKDANGCVVSKPVFLDIDPSPVVAAVLTNQCTAAEGNFTIDVTLPTAGMPPYSYSIDGGVYQNLVAPFSITGLSSGSHTVQVKDINGCGNPAVTIPVLVPLGLMPTVSTIVSCPSNVGAITANATGGSSTYTYAISPPAGTLVGNVFTNLPANTYTVTVTDAVTTCQISKTVVLDAPTPITFSTTATDVSCFGDSNGTITVILPATNDNPTYTYTLTATSGPALVVGPQSSNIFTGLSARTYDITVTSGKGCNLTQSETVGTPLALLVDASSSLTAFGCAPNNSVNTATVTINETAGTGTTPYTYSIDGTNYFTTNAFSIIDTGSPYNLTIYIKDANGCVATRTLPITPLPKITAASASVNAAIDCNNTGSLIVNVTGGSGNFTYQMLPGGTAQPSNIFTVTTPGNYYFRVNDVTTGCYFDTAAYTVVPFNTIDVVAIATTDVTCFGDSNGAITINVTGYGGAYNYEVFNSLGASVGTGTGNASTANPQPIAGLLAGNYTVVVTETASPFCVKTSNVVTIGSPSAAVSLSFTTVNDNCNVNAGQIVANAQGGTAPYLYQILPATATAPLVTGSGWTSTNTLNAESGNYVIYVKDANNCPQSIPVTIGLDPTPVVAAVLNAQCGIAEGQFAIDVTVPTAGIEPYSFSIDGGGFQIHTVPFIISNLSSGVHTIEIKDFNDCGSSIISVPILAPLSLSPMIMALPSCTDGDGALTLTATGGSGNYEYSIDSGTYQPSANFTAISSGSHTVTVRDVTTNCTKAIPVNLGAATPITGFAISKTDVTCNGGSNGVITATMTTPSPGVNDNPVYNYSLSGTSIRPSQLSNIFSGLTAGNYTVTVTSARGCTATTPITIVEPAIITVPAPTVAQFGCNSGSNAMNFATIAVTGVTGGSGIYNYEFIKDGTVVQSGNNNIYTEANLLGGTYTVNVYDSKGCLGTAASTVTINPFIALDKINVTVNNAITCVTNEAITVSATTIGGTPTSLNYTVQDSSAGVLGGVYSQTNTIGIFTGLPIGDYIITVTNPATGCSIQDVHYVNEPNTFDLTIDNIVDVTCFGGTNGSTNVTIVDRNTTNGNQAGAFSYTVTGPVGSTGTSTTAGPFTLTNLAAGTYTIAATLTSSPFCQVSKAFTINQPTAALRIIETHTPITCVGNDGTISATAAGGWPGAYEFQLELSSGAVLKSWSTISDFTGLTAGNYIVKVRDSKGCVATTTVSLVIPTPITVTASSNTSMLSCFGDKTATITVNLPSGGQGSNYLYTLNTTSLIPATINGPQASPLFNGLGAGTYTITVTDGYSCSATSAPIVINQPTKLSANLVVASTQTCLNQTQLTLTASGGTTPYFYSVDNVTYSAASFAPSVTFPVVAGTYSYYVKDANGCVATVSNSIKIDPLPPLVINLDKTNAFINCKGDNSGDIAATAQGGLGNYVYSLLDGTGNPITPAPAQLSPGNFTGLFAGNYMVRVNSGDCTTTSAVISITEPTAPLAAPYVTKNVSCNGAKNGEILINASGGTGMIQYAISPNLNQFDNVNTFTNLAPGNYDVIVQDVLGCYIKINFDITEPNLLTASTTPNSIIPEICAGDKDGAFSIDIAGGTAPYSVSLDNLNGTYTTGTLSQTEFDFTRLTGGNHVVYIRDAAGCTTDWSVPLPQSVNMSPVAAVSYDCVNNAAANSVTVTIDASITNPADVDYSLDGGTYQASNIFTNIPAGTHYVTTRHTNGCEQRTSDFNIVPVDPLTLVLNDGGLNEIVATAAGGGGNYQYTLNGESYGNTGNFIIYKSGDYTVTVTDANGCVASATRHFEYIDVCIPNHFTPNGDGIEDGWAPGCTINYTNLTFDIFDRYGRKVATYRLGQYWDGKYDGKELPSGDYWYVLKLNDVKDAREFVGHFTLYR